MQYFLVHTLFSAAYILILLFCMSTFIFFSILWSYWHDLMGAPEQGCILYASEVKNYRNAFFSKGGKKILCYSSIYGMLPFLAVALWAALIHLFYVCQKKRFEESQLSFHQTRCTAKPRIEAICCLICGLLNFAYALFIIVGFFQTCEIGRGSLRRGCHIFPNINIDATNPTTASCFRVFTHLDACSSKHVRRDHINTAALLIAAICFQFLSSTVWIASFVGNLCICTYYKVESLGLDV